MEKNIRVLIAVVGLILSISMLNACSDSSSDGGGMSWKSLNISDASSLTSALSGGSSIYAGGLDVNIHTGDDGNFALLKQILDLICPGSALAGGDSGE